MKYKDLIIAFLGRTLNKSAEEVAELLKEKSDETDTLEPTVLDELLKLDATRVGSFTAKNQEFFDNGFKKAQKEALSNFEKGLKEKYNVTEDKQGAELIDAIVMAKVKANGGELDDEKIKKSAIYLQTVDRLNKEKADAIAAETDKFKNLESSITKKEISSTVRKAARTHLETLGIILPEGKTADGKSKADIQIDRFLNELEANHEFEIKDNKILILKEGKLKEDAHGNMIEFNKFLTESASMNWDFKEGEKRKGAGNNNEGDNGGGAGEKKYSGPPIVNSDQYMAAIKDAKTPEEKQEITKVWNEHESNKF